MNEDASFFSAFINNFIDFIQKLYNFLTFIIQNVIEQVVNILVFFLGYCILADGDDGLDFMWFKIVFVDRRIAVA